MFADFGGKFKSWSPLDYIQSFLEKSQNENSFPMTYDKAHKDVVGDQQWFAQESSMQNCPSNLRATFFAKVCMDLDMENCGPTILAQLCAKLEIECPKLDEYVKHREDRLAEFEPFLDRGQAKALMIRLINGGSIHENERDETSGVDWLKDFIDEGWKIRRTIARLAEYAHIKERFQPKDKDKGLLLSKPPNIDAKVVSAVLFPLENQALEHIYLFFVLAGIIKDGQCVLVFDGIMVLDNKSNREHLTEDFLFKASQYVKEHTGLNLKIRIKEFKNSYELPEDYESAPENFFLIDQGDDERAAEILIETAGDRLKKCGSRFFFNHEGCKYVEGKAAAQAGILNLSKEVTIVCDAGEDRTSNYSKDTQKMEKGATPRILADPSIQDDNFVKNMWTKNLGFLAYTNGVYSFKDSRLLTFEEAHEQGIFFIHDTLRAYKAEVDGTVKKDLLKRIIESFMPDEDQRKMLMNSLSRALAGHLEDKRWFVCLGMRNCGKGILCKLLDYAFGGFVQTTNGENLLTKTGNSDADAAKAQSWIKDLEWKRIVVMQEMRAANKTIDGDLIKKICSNGDWIEVRQNHVNESRIQCQVTAFVMVNDICEVSPPDAYQTMHGFKLDMEYREKSDFDDLRAKDACPPANWRVKDRTLDEFVLRQDVLDAFTSIIFEAYTVEMQAPPQRVKDDTNSIKGEASVSVEERFAEIIIKGGKKDVLFYPEIQTALQAGGLGFFSPAKIDTLVTQIYNIQSGKPSRQNEQGKSVQGRGFWGLQISDQNYNEKEQRLKKTRTLKQSARMDFTNQNASPLRSTSASPTPSAEKSVQRPGN